LGNAGDPDLRNSSARSVEASLEAKKRQRGIIPAALLKDLGVAATAGTLRSLRSPI
jgi:hypothetical protein